MREAKQNSKDVIKLYDSSCSAQPTEPPQNCDWFCAAIWMPVCGSDWKTYSNMCALNGAICEAKLEGKTLKKLGDGTCASCCLVSKAVLVLLVAW